ncbi:MrcB superfamily penicillin-binding protein [Candidatus Cyrtobacter comes]|uniref:peptidoglycan glycosyltransferase n=1 Tax=Candidatus Cyrtobacter comes TaxID=675776 RepID=A0ABU5L7B0_9RICK|nr:transglycosylase domain-containing protein [Candidatus Cyrtobacter comes]MDZ5762017.1 MrcB superfamily penicillin-binding protein [Candidatus Cyrtobacter comes]
MTKKSNKKRGFFSTRIILKLFIYILLSGSISFIAVIIWLSRDLPSIETIERDDSQPMITIYGNDGTVLANYGDAYGNYLPYSKLPKTLIHAVIAIEDKRFFEHSGIDWRGILRAALYNQLAGKVVQGGSTITQQLSKIIFLSPEKSLKRKFQEAMLSFRLENIFSKEQILTMYLNRVFLGNGAFGVDAASRIYFKKCIQDASLEEVAIIAAMLKAPSRLSSENNEPQLLERMKLVLLNMNKEGYISDNKLDNISIPKIYRQNPKKGLLKNPYFTDFTMEEMRLFVNPSQKLSIYTTLVPFLQERLEMSVASVMSKFGKQKNTKQAAAVLMSNDAKIMALIGGTSYAESQFNRAIKAKRQPGSAFKLFVYLAALENGFNTYDVVDDFPITIGNWTPQNISKTSVGYMSFEEAFIKSNNIATVKIAEKIGLDKVSEAADRLGIHGVPKNIPSISLGSHEVTLIDMTAAYAVIANDGLYNTPTGISRITTGNSELYRMTKEQKRVISPKIVSIMDGMMRNTVLYGTGKRANLEGQNFKGKTGTSQDYRDALFIGYNNTMTLGIWVGNDDNQPMNGVTGATIPALIFKEFFSNLYLPN